MQGSDASLTSMKLGNLKKKKKKLSYVIAYLTI